MSTASTTGSVLHWAAGYDVVAWLMLRGKERQFRERLVDLARIQPGESVLDIGCGTGSLAIAAKKRAGASGSVDGIDPSPQMIAKAKKKAEKAGAQITFSTGVAEALAYPDRRFDAVVSTLMFHHLPDEVRRQCAREMHRVLKRGGRAFVVDFGGGSLFHPHGGIAVKNIAALLTDAGLKITDSGPAGVRNLNYVLAANA